MKPIVGPSGGPIVDAGKPLADSDPAGCECCEGEIIPGVPCVCDPEAPETFPEVWVAYTGQTAPFISRVDGVCYQFDPENRITRDDEPVSTPIGDFPDCFWCCFFPEDPPEDDPEGSNCCTDEEDPGKCYYLVLDTGTARVPLLWIQYSITASQAWGGFRDANLSATPPEDCYSCVGPCETASGTDSGFASLAFFDPPTGTEPLDGGIELVCNVPTARIWEENNDLLTDPGASCLAALRCHACSDGNCQSDTAPISVQDGGGASPFLKCVDVPGPGGPNRECDEKLCLGLSDLAITTGRNNEGAIDFRFRPTATPVSPCFQSAIFDKDGYRRAASSADCNICGAGEPDGDTVTSCVEVTGGSFQSTCSQISASLTARQRIRDVCEDFVTPGPTCTRDDISITVQAQILGMYQCAVAEMMMSRLLDAGHSVSMHRADRVRIGGGSRSEGGCGGCGKSELGPRLEA